MTNKVYGLRLDPRQAWAWQRLGNQQIRAIIAPPSICVECGSKPAKFGTRNGWFCFPCQDNLDQRQLLPEPESEDLKRQNRQLRTELTKLRSRVKSLCTKPDKHSDQQLLLFSADS